LRCWDVLNLITYKDEFVQSVTPAGAKWPKVGPKKYLSDNWEIRSVGIEAHGLNFNASFFAPTSIFADSGEHIEFR
jgi:hypothetical protein